MKIVRDSSGLALMTKDLSTKNILALDFETTSLALEDMKIDGIGIGDNVTQYYIYPKEGLTMEEIASSFSIIFEKSTIIFHNAKFDMQVMMKFELPLPENIHDTMIMGWLLEENRRNGLKDLAKSVLGREGVTSYKQLDLRTNLFRTEEDVLKDIAEYCSMDIKNTFDLFNNFYPQILAEFKMDYERIELPIIRVLTKMEFRGVKLDISWLKDMADKAEKRLMILEQKMKDVLEEPNLNIRSPQQLERILFEKLNYSPNRITDKGKKSTDNESLASIVEANKLGENDFVPLLLEFREFDKLFGTYLKGLPEQADKGGIIHASFWQHGTNTGRFSSSNPNLQNIPSRGDDWNVRRAFVPREGYKFIISDYSQIELRVLAHFSRDKNMVQTFRDEGDIHAKTMELTGTSRKEAKGINFGLIYGMGSRTLAKNLGITEEAAEKYMNKFFAGYPGVRTFIHSIQNQTLKDGYVKMITGRKRRFYDYKEPKWYNMVKRQAINTRIQGSAADLFKIAMVKLDKALLPFDSHQIIQVHDEIIIEAKIEHLEEVKKVVKETMENAAELLIPLRIGMEEGDYWVKG